MKVKVLRPFTQSFGDNSRDLVPGDVTDMPDHLAKVLSGEGYLSEIAVANVHVPAPQVMGTVAQAIKPPAQHRPPHRHK